MLEQQAKSNADLLERLLAKFPTSLDTASPSDTDPSTPRSKIKVPKWCDDETPHDYFTKYEQAMRHNGEPETQRGYLLPVYLSGKAQLPSRRFQMSCCMITMLLRLPFLIPYVILLQMLVADGGHWLVNLVRHTTLFT